MRFACAATALVFLLCGCSAATPTSAQAPSPVRPASASASPSGSASADASDVIDASAYTDADFASPDGSIRCSLTSEDATCDFPSGMKRSGVPSASKVCPGAPLKVAGVTVSGLAEFFCSRGNDAYPQQKGSAAVWARSAGVPTVTVGKEVLVTLPVGRTLKHGRLSCTSAPDNTITCSQSQTKASFTLSRSGVKLSAAK